ncbi:hypothetical protein AVEN_151387-1 [Araneus ventricosus]|uniref:Uncharacterized protein n=1 Tax=Araneus ventricosus TaxID=182803 RepID=A0A4Y2C9T6_ARAVE|nr:hypothetical protein AVEN_151387-1 [Araneus ventricosus]
MTGRTTSRRSLRKDRPIMGDILCGSQQPYYYLRRLVIHITQNGSVTCWGFHTALGIRQKGELRISKSCIKNPVVRRKNNHGLGRKETKMQYISKIIELEHKRNHKKNFFANNDPN